MGQDLTSETFLKGWESFKNGNKIENPQAYLYKTARNLVIDFYREKGKIQIVSADNPFIADPAPNLEEKAILTSDVNIIRQALTTLSDDYQNVIIWHYLDDLPISEVAKLLDRSEEATRVLLHRALNSLRQKINSV